MTSEILDVDDIIENYTAGDEDVDGTDKSPPRWQKALAALKVIGQLQVLLLTKCQLA